MPPTAESAAATDAYRARLGHLRDATARALLTRFQTVNLDRPADFARWADDGAALVEASQQHAVVMTGAYFETYLQLSGVEPSVAAVDPASYSGELRGMPLAEALRSAPAATYWRLGRSAGRVSALTTGMDVTIRLTRTAVMSSAREALTDQMVADPAVVGWERVTSRSPCGACLALAGRRMSDSHVFETHDRCHCTAEPVIRHLPDRVRRPTGEQLFAGMNDTARAELFAGTGGAAKARLVAEKGLDVLVSRNGGQLVETPLSAL